MKRDTEPMSHQIPESVKSAKEASYKDETVQQLTWFSDGTVPGSSNVRPFGFSPQGLSCRCVGCLEVRCHWSSSFWGLYFGVLFSSATICSNNVCPEMTLQCIYLCNVVCLFFRHTMNRLIEDTAS